MRMKASLPAAEGQLALELPITARLGREDFLQAQANERALSMIDKWPQWPDVILLLYGPPGSGKSHLLSIWTQCAQACVYQGSALPTVEELERTAPLALGIDNIDRVHDETALFHVLNYAIEHQLFLLMTAQHAPSLSHFKLPDLSSRLRRAPAVEICAPDDRLVRAVLAKLFLDRQLIVEAPTLDYVSLRLDRSLDAVRGFVAALDREAMAQGRPITRALAAEVMARCYPDLSVTDD